MLCGSLEGISIAYWARDTDGEARGGGSGPRGVGRWLGQGGWFRGSMFVGHLCISVEVGCQGLTGCWSCYALAQLCRHGERLRAMAQSGLHCGYWVIRGVQWVRMRGCWG